MGCGNENSATMELAQWFRRQIQKSNKESNLSGYYKKTQALGRGLIIDLPFLFLICRLTKQRPRAAKRLCRVEAEDAIGLRVSW
ncbi:hypothetical protein N7451_009065 [Penicillium sp. IBT 35674x]|nr:hypothetical protein N7451_009065 [Penicillium sp. IBT 35674x]